jgi:hypothetical protein
MAMITEEQAMSAVHTPNNCLANKGDPSLLHVASRKETDLSHVTAVFLVRRQPMTMT